MPPRLTVVVGSSNARATVAEGLGTLVAQCRRVGAELIVVDHSDDGTDAAIRECFPDVCLVRAPETRYIPELWAVGVERAAGEVVALTTAHCVPADDWVARVLEAHDAHDAAGIGGAIENDPAATAADWAVYFCRYHRFMPPLAAGPTADIAGDNASYKRWALDRTRDLWRDGFWEPDIHAEILRRGGTLRLEPRIVVRHVRSFGVAGFVRNRYRHGRQYGRSQGRTLGPGARVGRALRAPLVPAVLTGRVASAVRRAGRHAGPFARALPLLGLFTASWALGEAVGYLHGTTWTR